MKFEINERITTKVGKGVISSAVEDGFRKIARKVRYRKENLEIKGIETTFGAVNRKDTTTIEIKDVTDGFLVVANVNYRPSLLFWIFLPALIFFFFMPIIFYFIHKRMVQEAIQRVLLNIKNEYQEPK